MPSWQQIARNVRLTGELRVAVLGCSTSAGCGAADPSKRCDPSLAWPALMKQKLHETLQDGAHDWHGINVTVTTHAKNAVDASYFSHCTDALLPSHVHVVLLELFQNLYGPAAGLEDTLAAVRRVAHDSTIIFIEWLKLALPQPTALALREQITQTASQWDADVLDFPAILQAHTSNGLDRRHWYALGGKDHHPSRAGHRLIGQTAATFVMEQLQWGLSGHESRPHGARPIFRPHTGTSASVEAHLHPPVSRVSAGNTSAHKRQPSPITWPLAPRPLREQCFLSAGVLPIRSRGPSWRLVDDGGEKRVAKPGYASEMVGDVLTLGPLFVRSGHSHAGRPTCVRTFSARLGYLVSSRAGQGAFILECEGACKCRGIKSAFLRQRMPFPRIETAAQFSADFAHSGPIAVTATTTFVVEMASTVMAPRAEMGGGGGVRGCYVRIKHIRSRAHDASKLLAPDSERASEGTAARNASRVRIDSLVLSGVATANANRSAACP